jgi:hypothetical protein
MFVSAKLKILFCFSVEIFQLELNETMSNIIESTKIMARIFHEDSEASSIVFSIYDAVSGSHSAHKAITGC